jgi:inner membrane protease ATP23
MLGRASQSEIQAYNNVYDHKHAELLVKRAEENRDWLFQYSPVVRFLREETRQLGGDLGPWNVRCKICTGKQRGGFDKEYGILLCANVETNRKRLEETMAHEMVHAYDSLRWKFDELNMKHAACTEVSTTATRWKAF